MFLNLRAGVVVEVFPRFFSARFDQKHIKDRFDIIYCLLCVGSIFLMLGLCVMWIFKLEHSKCVCVQILQSIQQQKASSDLT